MREIWIGILASLFFAVTFVLNRTMELSGGSWLWSASLRYFFMVPFLIAIVAYRKGLGQTKKEMITKTCTIFHMERGGFCSILRTAYIRSCV